MSTWGKQLFKDSPLSIAQGAAFDMILVKNSVLRT